MNAKLTYWDFVPRDIQKHIMKFIPTRITLSCKIEVSDHDGYCSDCDCEYDFYLSHISGDLKDLPKKYEKYSIGYIIKEKEELEEIANFLKAERHLAPSLHLDGSGYCNTSKESKENGLFQHDYRITPVLAELS